MRSDSAPIWPHRRSRLMHALVWVVLLAFLVACTKNVVRGPMHTRHYAVDMAKLDARRIVSGDLEMESVVLTPAQWPLEASFKKLTQGDFVGIIENFDLSFRSSRLRDDTLERLFDAGYLPVFIRISNRGQAEAQFRPESLIVLADAGTMLYPVSATDLPGRFRKIDWEQTGVGVVLVALLVVLIVASAREGRSGGTLHALNPRIEVSGGAGRRSGRTGSSARPSEEGLLRAKVIKPGESIEGFVFFQLNQTVADWTTAHIEMLP